MSTKHRRKSHPKNESDLLFYEPDNPTILNSMYSTICREPTITPVPMPAWDCCELARAATVAEGNRLRSAFAKAFNVSNQRSVSVHTSAKDNERSYSTGRSISGRLRNSLFGAAFVRTFGLVRDPDEIWTLEKQTSIVKGKLSASTIPPNRRSTAQVVSDSPKTRLMKDIMHRDYVDVTFCEAPVRARRVLTPLNEALGLLHRPVTGLNNHTSADFEAASEMLSHEMGLIIETDYPEDGDEAITGRWFTRDRVSPQQRARTIVQLFQALAYRFKIQEQFLVIAENLTRLELLSINALYTSMNLSKDTKS